MVCFVLMMMLRFELIIIDNRYWLCEMSFIKLRLILQEPKPDLSKFLKELEMEAIQKGDLDLLLRKSVESKLNQFG